MVLYVWIYICVLGSTLVDYVATQNLKLECAEGWVKIYESCYLIMPQKHTWTEARNYCNIYGAWLAEPEGPILSAELFEAATTKGINNFWIGYNLITNEGRDDRATWSNGNDETGPEVGVWAPNEPDVYSGRCAYIAESSGHIEPQHSWYMTSCDHVLASVCERTPCPDDTFQCNNGHCVGLQTVCNGANNCGDESDERNCSSLCHHYYRGDNGTITLFDYSPNMNCWYTIEADIGKRIQMQLTLEIEENLDFFELWDGSNMIARLSGIYIDPYRSYVSSRNHITLKFLSDGSVQKGGFRLTWSTAFKCDIVLIVGQRLSGNQHGYEKTLTKRQDAGTCMTECARISSCWGFQYNGENCFMVTEAPILVEDAVYDVYVKTCPETSSLKLLDSVPVKSSNLIATSSPQPLYTPLYPFRYIGNMELAFTITVPGNNLITLQIHAVHLCCDDSINVHDGTGPGASLLGVISQTHNPGIVISTGHALYIYMNLKQHWSCNGVLMTYRQGCNITLTAESGIVSSPGYDVSPYPDISTCTWLIQPASRKSLKLTFTDFDTEANKDYLKIYEGVNDQGKELHTDKGFSGSSLPNTLTSSKGLFLTFTTSAIGNSQGFSASYSAGCPSFDTSLVVDQPSENYHNPDSVKLTCAEGYYFDKNYVGETSVNLSCQSDGSWNVSNIPFCERAYCGLAPALKNGFIVNSTGVQGNDTSLYSCNEGYEPDGRVNIKCLSDNTWEKIPNCLSPQCMNLLDYYPSGYMSLIHGNGTEHGSVARISCPRHKELIGPATTKCVGGVWKTELPYCREIPCSVPDIKNANIIGKDFVRNNPINIDCHTGYAIINQTVMFSGEFRCGVEDPLVCSNVDECRSNIDLCQNADCTDTDGGYTCTCWPGYQPVWGSTTHCEDIDECTTDLALCEHTCINLQGSYECSCNSGYDRYTSQNELPLFDDEDGNKPWHRFHTGHSCVLKRCNSDHILNIANGEALTPKVSYFYKDSVDCICNIGFLFVGTELSLQTVTCDINGQWNTRPVCEPAYCDESYGPGVTPVGKIRYGDKYRLNCTSRNNKILVLERPCGYDYVTKSYKTVGDTLTCPETECGPVPYVEGMKPFVTPCTFYNCTVVMECMKPYVRMNLPPDGNFMVSCNEKGIWDFRQMYCQGAQCPDPGYPSNGHTTLGYWLEDTIIVDTVENGSTVNFTCPDGYFPDTIDSMTCQLVGDGMAWDGAVPTCVDKAAPYLVNGCPDEIVVNILEPVKYEEPIYADNSGLVYVDVYPEYFIPGSVVLSSIAVTYIATDSSDNQKICQFRVLVKDVTPPKLNCKLPDVIFASVNNVETDLNEFAETNEFDVIIRAFPSTIIASIENIGSHILQYTGKDAWNNIATCSSQLKIEAPACNPIALHVYNGNIECLPTVPVGYNCMVTCKSNYVFYEDPSLDNVFFSCSGANWSREMPVCTVTDLPFYRITHQFKYGLNSEADKDCGEGYETQIRNQLLTLTNAFKSLCANATPSTANIDVSPSSDFAIVAEIDASNNVIVRLTVDINPEGLADTVYKSCSNRIYNALYFREAAVSSIRTLASHSNCPTAELIEGTTIQDGVQYICHTASVAQRKDFKYFTCTACPPGTYSGSNSCLPCPAGTYTDEFYAVSCKACPSGTNSVSLGLMYKKDCYDDCGMYLYSSTGKAPCTECPDDTFWVNGTTCQPCPLETYTKSRGARSQDACFAPCPAGKFSHDGLNPACAPCPKNFYGTSVRSSTCVECASNEVTLSVGETSYLACMDGLATKCYAGLCLNGGTCRVIRHEYACSCAEGFTGQTCETALTPCDFRPCLNGGTCAAQNHTHYTCSCPSSYYGTNCELDENNCSEKPCQNNGTCIDKREYFVCACASYNGYYGDRCQYKHNPCLVNPCQNSGECIPQGSYFRMCSCRRGFSGVDCEINIDECESSPCMNDGSCVDSKGGALCICKSGYKGRYCQQRDSSATCYIGACNDTAPCIDNYVLDKKYCRCPENWYYDEQYGVCAVITDECDGVECGDNGQCISYGGRFHTKCKCAVGYGGTQCQVDVNECGHNPCKNNATCTDHLDDYTCTCTLDGTGGSACEDNVNDCVSCVSDNTDQCTDDIDDYTCYCKDGYTGINCEILVGLRNFAKGDFLSEVADLHGISKATAARLLDKFVDAVNRRVNTIRFTDVAKWPGSQHDAAILNICGLKNQIPSCASLPCQHNGTCENPVVPSSHICTCKLPWTGQNCETEIDKCSTGSECLNGGTCHSTSDGFVCVCEAGYIGEVCDQVYDLCERASPCVEESSTCTRTTGNPTCTCSTAYTGASCETLLWYCSDSTCQNGGTCSVVQDIGVVCTCPGGFTGNDCSTDIDECQTMSCPSNSRCVDGINSATCLCLGGKVGEECEKDVDYDFDYVITPSVVCSKQARYGWYELSTSAFSVALWVRSTTINMADSFLTLYGLQSREEQSPQENWTYCLRLGNDSVDFHLKTRSQTIAKQLLVEHVNGHHVNIEDGLWHHFAVTWNNLSGYLTLYIDGVYNNELIIGKDEVLSPWGVILLGSGSEASPQHKFHGRISQLYLYNFTFSGNDAEEVYNGNITGELASPSLSQEDTLKRSYTVDYNSQLSNGICTDVGNCQDTSFQDSDLPAVKVCPEDKLVINTERVSQPQWVKANFSKTISIQSSTMESGETKMGWSTYGIGNAGYDEKHNAAVCTFKLYNKRTGCSDISNPVGGSQNCTSLDNGEGSRCEIYCHSNNEAPSEAGPVYYSCSKNNMWGQPDREVMLRYPPCAPATDPTDRLQLSMQYNTTEDCSTTLAGLYTAIMEGMKTLNEKWSYGMCKNERGLSDVDCDNVELDIACTGNHTSSVQMSIPYLSGHVSSGPVTAMPSDAMKIAIVDDAAFSFASTAKVKMSTLLLTTTQSCPTGNQLIKDKCVQCGSGFFFNTTTSACERCPRHTYRTVYSNTPVLSTCTKCSGSDKTNDTGAPSVNFCYTSCRLGKFYNFLSGMCDLCALGFYLDSIGQTSCKPCPIQLTTAAVGTTSLNGCLVHVPTTQPNTTGTRPDIEASTEEGLSVGLIVGIVIIVVVITIIVVIFIFCLVTKRLPCVTEKTKIAPTASPYKNVNRYGETNLKFVNYRLSDIRDYKQKSLDRIPIYPEPPSPEDTMSMRTTDMSVHVPIFTEKLNGVIHKKHMFISTGRATPEAGSELDHTLERVGSEQGSFTRNPSGHQPSTLQDSRHPEYEAPEVAYTATPPLKHQKRNRRIRKGRPPSELSPVRVKHPRTLSPMGNKVQVPDVPQSFEFIRALPTFATQRPEVQASHYEEFLERRVPARQQQQATTPPTSKMSDKILVDSDEDDFR